MTVKQVYDGANVARIFEKLYDLNTRGYYTAWLDFVGHTNSIAIKVIKGQWKENRKQIVICEYLVRLDRWRDSFTSTPFDPAAFIEQIDELIQYKPLKKAKR